jgi:hypothetical protein
VTTEIATIKKEKVIESENATTKIVKGIRITTKIVTVSMIKTTKNLSETVIVRGENVKG